MRLRSAGDPRLHPFRRRHCASWPGRQHGQAACLEHTCTALHRAEGRCSWPHSRCPVHGSERQLRWHQSAVGHASDASSEFDDCAPLDLKQLESMCCSFTRELLDQLASLCSCASSGLRILRIHEKTRACQSKPCASACRSSGGGDRVVLMLSGGPPAGLSKTAVLTTKHSRNRTGEFPA